MSHHLINNVFVPNQGLNIFHLIKNNRGHLPTAAAELELAQRFARYIRKRFRNLHVFHEIKTVLKGNKRVTEGGAEGIIPSSCLSVRGRGKKRTIESEVIVSHSLEGFRRTASVIVLAGERNGICH